MPVLCFVLVFILCFVSWFLYVYDCRFRRRNNNNNHTKYTVVLDLQGTQYTGQIYPGPTFMILTVTQDTHAANNKEDPNDTATPSPTPPYLKVEGMVDEFCRLVKTGNALDQMNATVQSGISLNNNTRDDSNDAEENNMRFSSYDDINVNHAPPSSKVGSASKASMASPAAASDNQKRPSSKTTTTATKRKKSKLK